MESVYGPETLEKEMILVWEDSVRFPHAARNSAQFNTYELFISGIFHLKYLNYSGPQITETAESKIMGKRGLPLIGSMTSSYLPSLSLSFLIYKNKKPTVPILRIK